MWILLGIGAIIFAIWNLIWAFQGKDQEWLGFASLSFTALTVCAFYADGAGYVVREDWSGLLDIMPTVSKMLWVCVILSILINSVPLVLKRNKQG